MIEKINNAEDEIFNGNFSEADHILDCILNNTPIFEKENNSIRRSYFISSWVRLAYLYEPTMNKVIFYKNKTLNDYKKITMILNRL